MKRVISIGEALIDFIPNQKGCELKNVLGFERVAGGAPANVSAVVAKLGGKSNFISKLGKDAFGNHIIEVLKEANVNVDYVLRSDKANTGLAFVSLKEDGKIISYNHERAGLKLVRKFLKETTYKDENNLRNYILNK